MAGTRNSQMDRGGIIAVGVGTSRMANNAQTEPQTYLKGTRPGTVVAYRLCPYCSERLLHGDTVAAVRPKWWQFLKFTEVMHWECAGEAGHLK